MNLTCSPGDANCEKPDICSAVKKCACIEAAPSKIVRACDKSIEETTLADYERGVRRLDRSRIYARD